MPAKQLTQRLYHHHPSYKVSYCVHVFSSQQSTLLHSPPAILDQGHQSRVEPPGIWHQDLFVLAGVPQWRLVGKWMRRQGIGSAVHKREGIQGLRKRFYRSMSYRSQLASTKGGI